MKERLKRFLIYSILVSCLSSILVFLFFLVITTSRSSSTYETKHPVVSRFGSQKFECAGFCTCDGKEFERRNSMMLRGVSGLFFAASSLLAYRMAKRHFDEDCQTRMSVFCVPGSEIIAVLDGCSTVEEEKVMEDSERENFFEFLHHCVKAKHLKRRGWVVKEVKEPFETVTGHMHCMALMSMVIPIKEKVDRTKILKMCLVHDLGETIVGDITPVDGVSDEEKFEMEEKAIQKLSTLVPGMKGKDFYEIWLEFEKGETKESKYARDLDKFDLLLQAFEYEKSDGIDLEAFFTYHQDGIETPEVRECLNELLEKRWKYLEEKRSGVSEVEEE